VKWKKSPREKKHAFRAGKRKVKKKKEKRENYET